MEQLIQANIFFFTTTIAVVVLTLFFMIVMAYLIRILKDAQHISNRVRKESDGIIDDVDALRRSVKHGGKKIGMLFGVGTGNKRSKTRR